MKKLVLVLSPALILATLLTSSCRKDDPPDVDPDPREAAQIDATCAALVACGIEADLGVSACASETLARPLAGRAALEGWTDCIVAAGGDCTAVEQCAPAPDAGPCEGVADGTTCGEGTTLYSCWNSTVEFTTSCGAWGLTCAELDGGATCQGDGPSCLIGEERCDGDDAVLCVGFREARFDCAQLIEGRTCGEEEGLVGCVPTDVLCSPVMIEEQCDGDVLQICDAAYQPASVDCVELGFARCGEVDGRASCVPVE